MKASRLKALLLVPVLALLVAAAPLVDPAPIQVPAGLSEKAVAKSIRLGVATRGWIVTRQEPGFMEATLNIRAHTAKIGIKYDTQSIQTIFNRGFTNIFASGVMRISRTSTSLRPSISNAITAATTRRPVTTSLPLLSRTVFSNG